MPEVPLDARLFGRQTLAFVIHKMLDRKVYLNYRFNFSKHLGTAFDTLGIVSYC
jgi:hypothetical protein